MRRRRHKKGVIWFYSNKPEIWENETIAGFYYDIRETILLIYWFVKSEKFNLQSAVLRLENKSLYFHLLEVELTENKSMLSEAQNCSTSQNQHHVSFYIPMALECSTGICWDLDLVCFHTFCGVFPVALSLTIFCSPSNLLNAWRTLVLLDTHLCALVFWLCLCVMLKPESSRQ